MGEKENMGRKRGQSGQIPVPDKMNNIKRLTSVRRRSRKEKEEQR